MKRVLFALALAVALSAPVKAGQMCDAAAKFEWKSPSLNGHCYIEWLWEITT